MSAPISEPRLAGLTTFRVGGPARRLVTATTAQSLVDAVRTADEAGEPVLLVAGGSNLLIGDDGFDGTVVRVATRGITRNSVDHCAGADVTVEAGEPWDPFVALAVSRGWSGLEPLSGIPGSVGATPIQNVGAYGAEVSQVISAVRTWDRSEHRVRTFFAADCDFAYRDSVFKRSQRRYVVLQVSFQLVVADLSAPVRYAELARALQVPIETRRPLAEVRSAVLSLRAAKGMVLDDGDHDTWSAGSFFTNPIVPPSSVPPGAPQYPGPSGLVKTSAAWLIDRAGFAKGFGLPGPASLSTKHTLALTNRGSASAADVLALAREVRSGVEAAFGITLVPEPELINCTL